MESDHNDESVDMTEIFGEPVYVYTRKQAIEDGFQVAVPEATSREAGIVFPVFINRTVWDAYVTVPAKAWGQDEAGRLWDILWMLRLHVKRGGEQLLFQLYVRNTAVRPKKVTLKAMCGPVDHDDPRPAITIMMTDED